MTLKLNYMNLTTKLFILFLTSIPCLLFSTDDYLLEKWAGFGSPDYLYFFNDNQLIIKAYNLSNNEIISDNIEIKDIIFRSDGYIETNIFGGNQILLFGANRISFITDHPNIISHFYPKSNISKSINNGWTVFQETGIYNVISNSCLIEVTNKTTKYFSTEYLLKTFTEDSEISIINKWNHELIPWAEGEEGPGIGVTLDITFKEPSNHILIINGYVDFGKTYLYKANNRVKTALFRSLDPEKPFEMEYGFEDIVKFHEIRFPRSTKKVQLEIVSVYPGEKWDDTVITGMMTRIPESENMYEKWKDTFWNDAIPYSDDLNIEWDP